MPQIHPAGLANRKPWISAIAFEETPEIQRAQYAVKSLISKASAQMPDGRPLALRGAL